MPKTPDDAEQAQVSSPTVTELARAELDLSLTDGYGANGPLRTLLRTFETASLGVGVASLSYPVVNSVVEQAGASAVLRGAAGVLAGLAFLKAEQKLTERTNSASSSRNKYSQLTANISRGGLRTAAFWAFIPTLAATWSDLVENEKTAYKVEAIRDRIEAYREDAGMAPAFLEVQADFQRDIIASLNDDASPTPKALAKMALYNDGESVRWNVQEEEYVHRVKTWNFSDRGREWTIVCYDTNHWSVLSPNTSWEIGADVEGGAVGETLQEQFPNSRLAKTLGQGLNESGLIDGNPAIVDMLKQVKTAAPVPSDFYRGLEHLSGFFPVELNGKIREAALDYPKQIEGAYVDGYAAVAIEIRERQFGAGALQDPQSYASTLSFINTSK